MSKNQAPKTSRRGSGHRKDAENGASLADCAGPLSLFLYFVMIKKQGDVSGLRITYSPLRLSASARGLLGLIYINIGILKVNAAALVLTYQLKEP
jgi:hypothetical protein